MIETAIQKGANVYVYGKGNHLIFLEGGELMGFTSTSVTIKKHGTIYVYSDKHRVISVH